MVICLGTRILLGVGWRPAYLQPRGNDPSGAEGTMGELGGLTCKVPVPSWCPAAAAAPVCRPGVSSRLCSVVLGRPRLSAQRATWASATPTHTGYQEGLGGLGLLVVARTLCLKP